MNTPSHRIATRQHSPLTARCGVLLRAKVLIVYIGLSSVFLTASDHSGDRAAIISVSILICMQNLRDDHGLGKLAASTWFDVFNLVQLGIQVR